LNSSPAQSPTSAVLLEIVLKPLSLASKVPPAPNRSSFTDVKIMGLSGVPSAMI